jgi:hypothetical protein
MEQWVTLMKSLNWLGNIKGSAEYILLELEVEPVYSWLRKEHSQGKGTITSSITLKK